MRHAELVARLDASAERLTARVLAEMYADPFWHARFGERADRHGRQDGRFHVDYVIQALQADDVGIIEHYARWLQQVLTSRRMCTRHLAENFARLADAIRDEAWLDGDAAIAMLDAARAALTYPAGPARDVQQAEPALAVAATRAVAAARYHGIFVGGSLHWKMATGAMWAELARRHGLGCHIGRVGTAARVHWARSIGATSVDSSLPLRAREHLDAFLAAVGPIRHASTTSGAGAT